MANSSQLTVNSSQLTADSFYLLPPIVILNGGKNVVQEKRETGQWHRVKNLWLWWHLTTFLTTVTDPSLSLQDDVLWSSTSLRGDAYRQSSFWTVARMPCGKDGKQQHDTEWRIYYFEWHLTTFLITVTDLSHSLRMTSYGFLHHSSKSSTSLRGDAYRQSSFWTEAKMPCGKNGKQQHDNEWRIYDSNDILPLSSPR